MSKKRESLFGFSKKSKEYNEIIGDLELFKEKSKKELSRIINKLKIILQENKKLNTETSSLKDTIIQLENENIALRGDFKAVIDDNVIKERLEQKVLDFRVLVASLEKENAILQRNLYGRINIKHNIRDINELEHGSNERIIKGMELPTQIREIPLDSAPLGSINVVEEVLPPGDINVASEPLSSQSIVDEEQNPEQVPEEMDFPLPPEVEKETFYKRKNELTGKQEEKPQEEISEIHTQRKRKCPKCGMTKRAFIKEIDDKTHIIMHSPRIYRKKYLCTSCFTEWK